MTEVIKLNKPLKIICVLLCIVLAFSGTAVFAEGLDNFKKSDVKIEFSDVSENDWFYQSVNDCVKYGFTNGTSETTFSPYDYVSIAEVIAFASRISAIYYGSDTDFSSADIKKWYDAYVDYAEEIGIIEKDEFSDIKLEKPASRQTVAYVLANSLPFTEFKVINPSVTSVPDVDSSNEYYNEIQMLYKAGIVSGKDESGNFFPEDYITRAETAAILTRIADPKSRITLSSSASSKEVTSEPHALDAVAISANASPAVFYIEIYGRDKKAIASGSGFFISPDGTCVTNYHVIADAYYAKIRTVDGTEYDVSGIYGASEQNDVAILKIDGSGFPYLEISDTPPVNGQKIYCIGSPLGLENTISEGIISNASRTVDDGQYIQISASISSGSSGGAVIDEYGKVIGITSAGFSKGQNLNLARPISVIDSVSTDGGYKTLYEYQTGQTAAEAEAAAGSESRNTPSENQPRRPSTGGKRPSDISGTASCYPETSVPTYEYVTGSTLRSTMQGDEYLFYVYSFDMFASMQYTSYLERLGFQLIDIKTGSNMGISYYYFSGNDLVMITQDMLYNQIIIAATPVQE